MGAPDPGLDRLRQELIAEIRASEARTAQRVEATAQRVEAVDARVASLEQRADASEARTGQRFEALAVRIDATSAETRRRFDVVAESLRSDIVLVVEGLATLDEKTERFRSEVREEFTKIDRRFLHLDARVASALERR